MLIALSESVTLHTIPQARHTGVLADGVTSGFRKQIILLKILLFRSLERHTQHSQRKIKEKLCGSQHWGALFFPFFFFFSSLACTFEPAHFHVLLKKKKKSCTSCNRRGSFFGGAKQASQRCPGGAPWLVERGTLWPRWLATWEGPMAEHIQRVEERAKQNKHNKRTKFRTQTSPFQKEWSCTVSVLFFLQQWSFGYFACSVLPKKSEIDFLNLFNTIQNWNLIQID